MKIITNEAAGALPAAGRAVAIVGALSSVCALAAICGLSAADTRAAAATVDAANTARFYQVPGGAKLYTETFGRGPPILFLHGGMLFFDKNFAQQRDYFAAYRTVIGIDQRGHGHSPDGSEHWMALLAKCQALWTTPVVIDPADLKKISAPVLVMAGDHDFTSIEESTEIFRGLPNGQLFIVPGTGHGTLQTRPDFVNPAIREFLDPPPDGSGRIT